MREEENLGRTLRTKTQNKPEKKTKLWTKRTQDKGYWTH